MIKFFHFLNTFIVLTVFVGILAVTFISLESLSPVAYEDYLAYKEGKSGTTAVAGISTDKKPETLEFINLLETKKIPYQLDNTQGKLSIQFTLDAEASKSPMMRLPIVSLLNKSASPLEIYVTLDSAKLTIESSQLKIQPSLIEVNRDNNSTDVKNPTSVMNLVEIKANQSGSIDVTNLKPGTYTLSVLYFNNSIAPLESLP